jgi:hypothetical protein
MSKAHGSHHTPSSEVSYANQVGQFQNHLVANMSGSPFMPNTAPNFLHSVFSSMTSFKNASTSNPCSWVLDTGATDHMICSFSLFTTVIASVSKLVKLPNGNFVPVTHIGTVRLSSTLILTNVLYVPFFSFNLISVSQLTKTISCCLLFFANTCYIHHLHPWKTIGVGRESGGLFHLQCTPDSSIPCLSPTTHSFSVTTPIPSSTYHCRLGHLSDARMKLLSSQHSHISFQSKKCCNVCPLAKQHRLVFPISHSISANPFDLVHCDIWGPYSTASLTGAKYFITIVDDCTRYTWVHLMNNKAQVRSMLCSFFQLVATQFQCKIKYIRSDNGVEFQMTEIFQSQGVIHQLSCVETPQQNFVVERKHLHLLNVARSLRFQVHLPLFFWGECVLTAAYIINRIPTPILSNISPFEKLFHTSSSFSHFRVFGCFCFASTLAHHRTKFAPRAKSCIFIGYPFGIKGYKVFDIQTKSILVSRDVIFHENAFLYKTSPFPPSDDIVSSPVLPIPVSVDDYVFPNNSISPIVPISPYTDHISESVPISDDHISDFVPISIADSIDNVISSNSDDFSAPCDTLIAVPIRQSS